MKKPLISKCLKAGLGFFALVGLLVCLLLGYACFTYPHDGPYGYVGEDCHKAAAFYYLPLPEQDEEWLPLALDEHWGLDYYAGMIAFRAPQQWQELLCRFYPHEAWKEQFGGIVPDADEVDDTRIAAFIRSREWAEFHQARVGNSGTFFTAYRDASGEYVMLEFFRP